MESNRVPVVGLPGEISVASPSTFAGTAVCGVALTSLPLVALAHFMARARVCVSQMWS
jgi:hypothetical protein